MAFNYVRKLTASDGLDYFFRDMEREIPTLTKAPTKSTGKFVNEDGWESSFVPGDYCRVQNAEAETGYDFYLLKDVAGSEYKWELQAIHKVETGDAAATTYALRAAIAGEDIDGNVTYSDMRVKWDVQSITVPASGGKVTCPSVTYSQTKTTKNEDGSTTVEEITSGADVLYYTRESGYVEDPSELTMDVASLGTTGTGNKSVGEFYAMVGLNDKVATSVISVIQEANTVVDLVEPELVISAYEVQFGPDGSGSRQVTVTGFAKRAWASEETDSYKTRCDVVALEAVSGDESLFTCSVTNNSVDIRPVNKNYSLEVDNVSSINISGSISYNGGVVADCPVKTVQVIQTKDSIISDRYAEIYVDGELKYNNVDKYNSVTLPVTVPVFRQDRYTTYMSGKKEEQQYLIPGTFILDEDCYFAVIKDDQTGEIEVMDNNEARRSFTVNLHAENEGQFATVSYKIYQSMGNPYAVVDLGLPSGTRWCAANIGADAETDPGEQFAFGDVEGHTGGDYLFNRDNYEVVGNGVNLKSDFTQGDTQYDAATMNAGSNRGVPTLEQLEELISETEHTHIKTETEDYWVFKARIGDKELILGTGAIWSNHVVDGSYAKALLIGDELRISDIERYAGSSVRGVEI